MANRDYIQRIIVVGDPSDALRMMDELNQRSDDMTSDMGGQFDRLGLSVSSVAAALGGLFAAFSVAEIIQGVYETALEFDKMQASLITMTGSVENAAGAFEVLEGFAATTPYTLDQSVNGFNKLVSLGLKPSEEALQSYGNTASAMGKDMEQMIEAVADASSGEMERLKEFGSKASKQGDEIAFTFQGVTKTVKNNAEDIQQYLIDIGNTQFAGAMEQQMKTLPGAVSNAEDALARLSRSIGDAGATDLFIAGFRGAGEVLSDLSTLVSSGLGIEFMTIQMELWRDSIIGTKAELESFNNEASLIAEDLSRHFSQLDISNVLSDAFLDLPVNFKTSVEIIVSLGGGHV